MIGYGSTLFVSEEGEKWRDKVPFKGLEIIDHLEEGSLDI